MTIIVATTEVKVVNENTNLCYPHLFHDISGMCAVCDVGTPLPHDPHQKRKRINRSAIVGDTRGDHTHIPFHPQGSGG
jgi:hypothetical protein